MEEAKDLLGEIDCVVICVKSPYFRKALSELSQAHASFKVLWATKGFDLESGALLSKIVSEYYDPDIEHGVLSGPTFAEELAAGTPAQVQHVARTYFQPTSRVTGWFFPDNNTGAT